jgi:hypothetical protein
LPAHSANCAAGTPLFSQAVRQVWRWSYGVLPVGDLSSCACSTALRALPPDAPEHRAGEHAAAFAGKEEAGRVQLVQRDDVAEQRHQGAVDGYGTRVAYGPALEFPFLVDFACIRPQAAHLRLRSWTRNSLQPLSGSAASLTRSATASSGRRPRNGERRRRLDRGDRDVVAYLSSAMGPRPGEG